MKTQDLKTIDSETLISAIEKTHKYKSHKGFFSGNWLINNLAL